MVDRMLAFWPYMMVSQPTVSRRDTQAAGERRGDNIMTVYPRRLRAKNVTTMLRSERVNRATMLPSRRGCHCQQCLI